MTDHRPVLFVTGNTPPSRVEPFRLLAERENVVFALFGGGAKHALSGAADPPFPHRWVGQHELARLAASREFRAVICTGGGGRLALPLAYAGTRRTGAPFVLWASLWSHPKNPAGLAGYPLMRRIYRDADAIFTYGPHVSDYVRAQRATGGVFAAPQAVDNEFWSRPAPSAPAELRDKSGLRILFSGRLVREKGVRGLLIAWQSLARGGAPAELTLVGCGPERARAAAARASAVGERSPELLRNFYAASHVLVLPSISTATFREPWGLVCNEAMNQGLPIIASDAVGAVAGGLVRHERNGLVVPAGDSAALASALARLRDDADLRHRLGEAGRSDVTAYTHVAWVGGVRRALASVGAAATPTTKEP